MKFEIDFIYKTVLIQAIENGNKEMAKLLLLWNKTDVNLFTISKKNSNKITNWSFFNRIAI